MQDLPVIELEDCTAAADRAAVARSDLAMCFDTADTLHSGQLTHPQFEAMVRTMPPGVAPDPAEMWERLRDAPPDSLRREGMLPRAHFMRWVASVLPECSPSGSTSGRLSLGFGGSASRASGFGGSASGVRSAGPLCVLSATEPGAFHVPTPRTPGTRTFSPPISPVSPAAPLVPLLVPQGLDRHSCDTTSTQPRSPLGLTVPLGQQRLDHALEGFLFEYEAKVRELAEAAPADAQAQVELKVLESLHHRHIDGVLAHIARRAVRQPDLLPHVAIQDAQASASLAASACSLGISPAVSDIGGDCDAAATPRRAHRRARTLAFASGMALQHAARTEGSMWALEGAVMQLEVLGHEEVTTAVTEENPHALATVLNSYVERLLHIAAVCGGDIVSCTATTATVAWWGVGVPVAMLAEAAAAASHRLLSEAGSHRVLGTDLEFTLRIGAACGSFVSFILSPPRLTNTTTTPECYHFLCGPPVIAALEARDAAPSGAALLDAVLVGLVLHLNTTIVTEATGTAFRRLTAALPEADYAFPPNPKLAVDQRAALLDLRFIAPFVGRQLLQGTSPFFMAQSRPVVALSVAFGGAACDDATWFTEVHAVLSACGCSVVHVEHCAEGSVLLGVFNLFLLDHGSPDSAVDCAIALRAKRSDSYVGIAAGRALCGVFGSNVACRWDISGEPRDTAIRLQRLARREGYGALIDSSVVATARDHSVLTRFGDVADAHGALDAFILKLVPRREQPQPPHVGRVPHLHFGHDLCPNVHEAAIDTVRRAVGLGRRQGTGPTAGIVVLRGPPGAGKLSLLHNAIAGTPFVPLVHTAAERDRWQPLALLKTIATWFAASIEDDVREAAADLGSALTAVHRNKAFTLALRLVQLVRRGAVPVALMVRRAQFLDESSASFLAALARQGSSGGWITLATCYAVCGIDAPDQVFRSFRGAVVVDVGAVPEDETDALLCHVLQAKATPVLVQLIHRKASGYAEYVAELARFIQRRGLLSMDAKGRATMREARRLELEARSWGTISPPLAEKAIHVIDRLTPELLALAKTVCAITEQRGITAFFPAIRRVVESVHGHGLDLHELRRLEELQVLVLCHHRCTCHTGAGEEMDAATFLVPPVRDIVDELLVPDQRAEINAICAEVYADTHPMDHPLQHLVRARHYYYADNTDAFLQDMAEGWAQLQRAEYPGQAAIDQDFREWLAHVPPAALPSVAPGYALPVADLAQRRSSADASLSVLVALDAVDRCRRPLEMGPAREFLRALIRVTRTFARCCDDGDSDEVSGSASEASSRAASPLHRRSTAFPLRAAVPLPIVDRLRDALADYVLIVRHCQEPPHGALSPTEAAAQEALTSRRFTVALEAVRAPLEAQAGVIAGPRCDESVAVAKQTAASVVAALRAHVEEEVPCFCDAVVALGAPLHLRRSVALAHQILARRADVEDVGFHVDLAALLQGRGEERDGLLCALDVLQGCDGARDKNVAVLLYEHVPQILAAYVGTSLRLRRSFCQGLKLFYMGLLQPDAEHAAVRRSFVAFIALWCQCCRQSSLFT